MNPSDSEIPPDTPSRQTPADESSVLLQAARALGMDSAIGFAVLARIWQLLTGPATQLLIPVTLTVATQDYYYAFGNMLAMQVFVELGLSVILINAAGHEWARLNYDGRAITGAPEPLARLTSLARRMFRWYATMSLFFGIIVGIAGLWYFNDIARLRAVSGGSSGFVYWVLPWLAIVVLNGVQLTILPRTSLLEGCGQLRELNRFRFAQAIGGTITVWVLLASGCGLWALAGSAAVRLGGEWWLTSVRYRPFFAALRLTRSDDLLDWRSEILPLQWRMGLQGSAMWFASQMPGLVVMRSAEGEAGRLGMTMTVLTAIQSASMAWIETRRPQFVGMISRSDYAGLDRLFFRMTGRSILLLGVVLTAFCFVVAWLGTRSEWLPERLSGRMLPLLPTVIYSFALLGYQFVMCSGIYVRAHRRDPYLVTTLISCATIASLQFVLGRNRGTFGLAIGYAIGVWCVQLPLSVVIWQRARRLWHRRMEST